VRFHYGHSDVFDRIFHLSRGGISKASPIINLSEHIFSGIQHVFSDGSINFFSQNFVVLNRWLPGYNTVLRRSSISHREYIQVGKGRSMGLNQISLAEARLATGSGEQTISRDLYRLGHGVDFFRMCSIYYTTIGPYFNALVCPHANFHFISMIF
jgi:callose synthase